MFCEQERQADSKPVSTGWDEDKLITLGSVMKPVRRLAVAAMSKGDKKSLQAYRKVQEILEAAPAAQTEPIAPACETYAEQILSGTNQMISDEAKELVARLRKKGLSNGSALGQHSGLFDEAADMIEALLQSSNAALLCGECRHSVNSKMPCAYKCNNRQSPCYGRITCADFGCMYGERKKEDA